MSFANGGIVPASDGILNGESGCSSVWELFSSAQHLHFESGDIFVITAIRQLEWADVQRIRDELDRVSEGVRILVKTPDIEIARGERA